MPFSGFALYLSREYWMSTWALGALQNQCLHQTGSGTVMEFGKPDLGVIFGEPVPTILKIDPFLMHHYYQMYRKWLKMLKMSDNTILAFSAISGSGILILKMSTMSTPEPPFWTVTHTLKCQIHQNLPLNVHFYVTRATVMEFGVRVLGVIFGDPISTALKNDPFWDDSSGYWTLKWAQLSTPRSSISVRITA